MFGPGVREGRRIENDDRICIFAGVVLAKMQQAAPAQESLGIMNEIEADS